MRVHFKRTAKRIDGRKSRPRARLSKIVREALQTDQAGVDPRSDDDERRREVTTRVRERE